MLTVILVMVAIALVLALFLAVFFAPGWAGVIAGIIFFLSLAMAIFFAMQKQTKLYREKQISRTNLARNFLYEIIGILLAIACAGLLGRYIVEIATDQISNGSIKLLAGIIIGLLAGIGVGILVTRAWGKLIKTAAEG